MADSKKYNGSTWEHSLRKLTTSTEAVENPLYSDGTAITNYTIKGNMQQTGTPTPSSPVPVVGVGVRTENVYDKYSTVEIPNLGTRYGNTCAAGTYSIYNGTENTVFYGENNWIWRRVACEPHSTATVTIRTASCGFFMPYNDASLGDVTIVVGSTAPDHYIPYGYKIPILSGGVTTNIYLGSTQTVRAIKKLVFDGTEDNWRITGTGRMGIPLSDLPQRLTIPYCTHFIGTTVETYGNMGDGECSISVVNGSVREFGCYDSTITTLADFKTWLQQQYANGTPVTVWYVLATAETAAVNEPLMKIGTYTDTLSNAASIPTTEGANSITVDTTVQPSEFTATWTGWHNANVKEWDGSQWNE